MSSEDDFEDCVDHKDDQAKDHHQDHHEEDKFQEPGKFYPSVR
jgi:hypothetical protein